MYEFTILFSKGKVKGQMVQFVVIRCHFLKNYTQLKYKIKFLDAKLNQSENSDESDEE